MSNMDMMILRCEICGQVFAVLKCMGNPPSCCGQHLSILKPNTIDASFEKHVPVFEVEDGVVRVLVGETPHPMTEEHFIEWIAMKTRFGCQRRTLMPGDEPRACFALCEGDEVEAVYAYCNIHFLWKG